MTQLSPVGVSASSASILVVDDTPANLQLLARVLKGRGYRVRPVPSGALALQAARLDPPNLILLDINMPDMSGYEVCEQLKADPILRGIPVIFLSALTEPLDKVKAFATGGVDYVTKPFQMEELYARLETHLHLRRLQTDLENYSRQLERARHRLKLDLEMAGRVQRGFLPEQMPQVPGYEFAGVYEPAHEIGGDYYDLIPLPGNRIAVLVGDVAGKGVAAALLMAKLGADARFCMLTEQDPATAFKRLNALMIQGGFSGRFMTLVAAILDPGSHRVTIVNAGHPPPLIYRSRTRSTGKSPNSGLGGPPLGVVDGCAYPAYEIALEPGDSILTFTDGIIEATNINGSPFDFEGVYAAVQNIAFSPRALVDRVLKVVKEFTAGRTQSDDIAMVGFGRTG